MAPRRSHKLLATAASALAALLLLLAAGEAGTRLLARDGRLYDIEMWKYARALKLDAPADAPEMHHWHRPGAAATLQNVRVEINSKGLRDVEHEYAAAPGVTRVLVLGDSITLGWGVTREESYPRRLERLLNEPGAGRHEVVNGGVGNYTTRRIIGFYRHELHKYDPRVIVFAFYLNNANETPDSPLSAVFDTPLEFPVFVWSRLQRVLSRYGGRRDFDRYYAELYREGNPRYEDFRSRLLAFLAERRAEGRSVLLVSLPDVRHLTEPRDRYAAITQQVAAIAREAGVSFLDLYPSVRGLRAEEIMSTPEDRHPNALGHERFALGIRDALLAGGIEGGER